MRVHVILNRHGGTLRTTNLDWLSDLIVGEFAVHGHQCVVEALAGKGVVAAIEAAAKRNDIDVLIVGGGDGTVSAAVTALTKGTIALGILPVGTMNLFARTLQIPLDLQGAVAALATGQITEVDVASVNGEPFAHQFALGLHARMVRMRGRFKYGSRIGKIAATLRSIMIALRRLPAIELELELDGETRRVRTPALAVSNNMYGEGHIPYADDPRGGILGVYICETRDVRAIARLTFDIMIGNWRRNRSLGVYQASKVTIRYFGKSHDNRAVMDGELVRLEPVSEIELHPKALKVLVPAEATYLD
ncbi:diacylglycerol/lipid kinase family protein [Mangrovicella endophytica]|uniref:diacylglycerol/lipid kinase family protein n=1 Tax=Mangrovicella endophytica TaxID=2066697 RepID=UPI000C9E9EE2|nr:diacylglycerol kinase family protein [Mangrovicella endophytica]